MTKEIEHFDANFYDADEKKQAEKDKKAQLIDRIKHLDDIRWVLSNAKGRRLLWWVLGMCGVFRASFVPKDTNQTAFNEGRRDVGLRLLADVQSANPKAYSQMQDEHLAENGKKNKEN